MNPDYWTLEEGEVVLTDGGPILLVDVSPPWSNVAYAIAFGPDDTLALHNALVEALSMGGTAP